MAHGSIGDRIDRTDIESSTLADDNAPLLAKVNEGALSKQGHSTLGSAIAILLNTVLGTGQLAMPHAFASAGLIPGLLTTLFCGCTASFGLYLLSRSAPKAPHRTASFSTLCQITVPSLAALVDLAVFLKCFGVSISYLVIIGALLPRCIVSFAPKRYEVPEWLLDRNLWVMLAMTALVPLSFLRRLDSLKAISYIALGTVANLVFVVIYKFLNQSGITDQDKGPVLLFDPSPKFFTSLPVQVFAFTCAQNIFGVYNELQRNTQKRLNRVIVSSIGGATIIYETLGLLGYLTFGAAVGSNIVEQYPHSMLVSICQLGIVILVLFSYPLQLHPCRASLDNLLRTKSINPPLPPSRSQDSQSDPDEIPLSYFVVETTLILLATFFLAIGVTNLETVLGFVGATGSTIISFILPAVFYISLFRHSADPSERRLLAPALALFGWGVFVMVTTLGMKLYALIDSPVIVDPSSSSSLILLHSLE